MKEILTSCFEKKGGGELAKNKKERGATYGENQSLLSVVWEVSIRKSIKMKQILLARQICKKRVFSHKHTFTQQQQSGARLTVVVTEALALARIKASQQLAFIQ